MVEIIRGAVHWFSGLAIDADGAPRAYGPPGLDTLDYLGNAGKPGNWYGLVCNSMGVPITQGENDPAPGYYVSTTALVDRAKGAEDPARYVDSSSVPYVVMPPDLRRYGVRLGDVAMVLCGGKRCGAIVADVGPIGHFGEGSIALADALGIPSSPKHGGTESGVEFLIFPGSSAGWPRPLADIQAQATRLYEDWNASASSNRGICV